MSAAEADVETKHQKFQRLSARRLERAVHHILLLRNLASNDYESTPEEAEALIAAMQEPVDEVALAFGVVGKPAASDVIADEVQAAEEVVQEPVATAAPVEQVNHVNPNKTVSIQENLIMQRIGPEIGKAMEALIDNDPDAALRILTDLMRS